MVARLTEHDDVIKHCSEGPRALVLHWAPHLLGLALIENVFTQMHIQLAARRELMI